MNGTSNPPKDERPSQAPGSLKADASTDGSERRTNDRFEVTWSVDCETEDTFLYAMISNISELGIFVRTTEPLYIGTRLQLRFSPPGMRTFTLAGQVQWVNPIRALGDNPNPGMGIRFLDISPDDREQIVEAIRTIAYVRSRPS